MTLHHRPRVTHAILMFLALFGACAEETDTQPPEASESTQEQEKERTPEAPPPPVVEAEQPMLQAVPFWQDGKRDGEIDALGPDRGKFLVLDLGEAWVPYLFTNGSPQDPPRLKNVYRETYLQLAQERFPDNLHGERARDDKYLELYGIMPTLQVLRTRMKWALDLKCAKNLDLSALASFEGHVPFTGQQTARNIRSRYLVARKHVRRFMREQKVATAEEIDPEKLRPVEQGHLRYYNKQHPRYEAVVATQARLRCEGYIAKRSPAQTGALDWSTHEALAAFERRHRVYGWGYIGSDTLRILQMDTAQSEQEAVLRVLTERAMHSYRAVEDGSVNKEDGTAPTYKGADGQVHQVPNLEAELRASIQKAFGLDTPEATSEWLEGLGDLPRDGHLIVALPAPPRPEYHRDDMKLFVEIDRGDVWFEFPYDEAGRQRAQPVSRRPRTTLYTSYLDQKIPLVRLGTTIGGWRTEFIDEEVYWKYKGSPVGEVIWKNIVSAPVWLPPDSTPPRALLTRPERRRKGEPEFVINYHEMGPSYASAYGLVAAYHKEFVKTQDGEYRITHDDGIRSHGSVDYMSIMRRHSHGCHRLHNHLAVRLFSFVLNHRPHKRVGHYPISYVRDFEYEGEEYHLEIDKGGYVFTLDEPIHVRVLEGRIRGNVEKPIETPVPRYNRPWGAYMLPDGGAVIPLRDGTLVPTTRPPMPEGGVEGGVLYGIVVDPSALDGGVGSEEEEGEGVDAGVPAPDPAASATVEQEKKAPTAIPMGGASPIALPGL